MIKQKLVQQWFDKLLANTQKKRQQVCITLQESQIGNSNLLQLYKFARKTLDVEFVLSDCFSIQSTFK